MESMGNNINRTFSWCRAVDRFIVKYDYHRRFLATRELYYINYMNHLESLIKNNQLIIQEKDGKIIGILGWILINKEDEYKINKIRWQFPENISKGNILYITLCLIHGGNLREFIYKLKNSFITKIDEIFWFNISKNKFIRKRNILKEICHV